MKRGPKEKLEARDKFELRQLREAGVSVIDACNYKGCSRSTGLRALAELRKKLGPEKLPNGRRARSYLGRLEINV
jgi:hypothetical protein